MAKMTPLQRARQNERLANEALAAGNIAAAQAYQANLTQQVASRSLPGVSNVATRVNTAVTAAQEAAAKVGSGGGGGDGGGDGGGSGEGGGSPAAPTYTPPAAAFSALQLMESTLRNAIGVEGLGAWAAGLFNRGASPTEIIQSLRYGTDTSPEGQAARARYLEAFPRIDEFIRDGVFAGEQPELQYISYRNTVSEAAQRFGINSDLVTKNKIADYVGNRVSAAEIADRMGQAATAVATTPPETISILRDFYGVQNGDLISFYLDPDTTEAMLTRRYTAARIGTEAQRQQFGIDVQMAEDLAMRGITADQANAGFGQARAQSEFMFGRGEKASQRALIGAQFGEEQSRQQMERIARSRTGAFQGGGSFVTTQEGIGGLSAASAT